MKSKLLFLCAILAVMSVVASGQTSPNLENGFKRYGSYDGTSVDTINVLNGNLMIHAPLLPDYPQRGALTDHYFLYVSSKSWNLVCTNIQTGQTCTWETARGLAGVGVVMQRSSDLSVQRTFVINNDGSGDITESAGNYTLTSADSATHQVYPVAGTEDGDGDPTKYDSVDTTGYHVDLTPMQGGPPLNVTVTDRHGVQYLGTFPPLGKCDRPNIAPIPSVGQHPPLQIAAYFGDLTCSQTAYLYQMTDSNGNQASYHGPQNSSSGVNTLGGGQPLESGTVTNDSTGCATTLPFSSAITMNYTGVNGSAEQLKLCMGTVQIQTAFDTCGKEAQGAGTVLTTVIQADGSKWSFNYDSYANLTYVGLPTGGSITYTWTMMSLGGTCSNYTPTISRAVASRTLNDNNGHSYTWQYQWGTPAGSSMTNVVTDPLGNDTVHVFSTASGGNIDAGFLGGLYETSTLYYHGSQGSGQLMKRVDTTYSGTNMSASTGVDYTGNVLPTSIQTTIYPSGKVSLVTKQYDTGLGANLPIFGDVTVEKDYDWGQGSPGGLLRETDTSYQWQVNSAYLTAHLLDLPASVVVKDGSGCALSETDYNYDETAYLTSANISTQHVAPPYGVRGNLSTVTKWLAPTSSCNPKGGTAIVSHSNWYDTGEVYQQIDPLGRTTTHSYDPYYVGAFSTQTCSPTTNGGATAHCVSGTYDLSTGLLTSLTNENATAQASGNTPGDSAHTSNYSYDVMERIVQAQAPPDPANGNARATHSFTYSTPNAFPLTLTGTKSITATQTDSATATFDGFGRPIMTQHPLPNGTAEVDTAFDALGRVATVTNPYFSTSDPTYGITQTAYDALGRATQVTEQDGSVKSVAYSQGGCSSGDDTTTTDEAAKPRRACTDALGRLVEVDEPGDPIVNFNAAAAPASGVYSMTGFPDSSGEHDAYVGTDQHIYQLVLTPAGWVNQDLTAFTNGALAAAGSAMTSFTDNNGEHLLYVGANQHVYQMYFSVAQWQWYNQDLTALTGNTLASLSTGLSSFSDSAGEHVMYVATSQHICQLFYSVSAGWQNQDITAITGGTLAANATGLSNFSDTSGAHVVYEGINQHIYQFFLSPSGWINQDLTAYGNGPLAALSTPLSSMVDSFGEHVFYFGTNQHVDQLGYSSTSGWASQDLTAVTGSTLAATGSPLSSFADADGEHILYQGANQHIIQLYFSVAQWQWYNQDLTAWTASAGANGGGLAAFADSQGEQVFYTNGQQVNELEWNGTAWQFANVGGPSLGQNFFVTQYGYDGLGNLLSVTQKGDPSVSTSSQWRVRSFTYDTLGRLLTATNPESGKISYSYDANGNLLQKTSPAPNQTGSATVTTSYTYDELNRLTQKTYSDGTTPKAVFSYDLPAPWGWPLSNYIGELVIDATYSPANGATLTANLYNHDIMGRVSLHEQGCTGGDCVHYPSDSVAYTFDLNGDVTSEQVGQSNVFNVIYGYSYDSAARLTGMSSNLVDAQHPATLATVDPSLGYYPTGEIRKMTLGNGLTETSAFNNRLQPCRMNVNSSSGVLGQCADNAPTGTVLNFAYGYNAGSSDNGNVMSFSATGTQNFSRTYAYDSLNRLNSMSAPGDACSGLSWQYDAWGNRTAQNATGGSCHTFQAAATAQNQLVGYQYDAAGNMTSDGSHTYTYDAENRIVSVDGGATTYQYDAQDHRVTKTTGGAWRNYLFAMDGNVRAETTSAGWQVGYAYFGGELLAQYRDSTTYFVERDHLGTTRLLTKVDQTVYDSMDYLPYGEQIAGGTGSTHKFTGKERDSETNLDYFGARYYSNGLGRFVTPDWAAKATAVPYAEFPDPQSLNLYSYVRNVPTTRFDQDGHFVQVMGPVPPPVGGTCPCPNNANGKSQGDKNNNENQSKSDSQRNSGGARQQDNRLPQDRFVNSKPPAANNGKGTVGPNVKQNLQVQKDVAEARANGATDIRVNQQQVNAAGERVGTNRPDLQYTDANGQRVYIEYESSSPGRGPDHSTRIRANDSTAIVITKTIK